MIQRTHQANRGTILVVEDEAGVRRLLQNILSRHGYRVLPAESAERALEQMSEHEGEISLVITDLLLPSMGGRELIWRLCTARPELSALLISGYADAESALLGLKDKFNVAFLLKPATSDTLLSAVRAILGEDAASAKIDEVSLTPRKESEAGPSESTLTKRSARHPERLTP